MNIPSYVTIYNDPKAGRSFLCNPCQVHCNSDTQITQHLTSKKHVDKVNGKTTDSYNNDDSQTNLTPAALISWTAEQQANATTQEYYKYDPNRKSNLYCEVCRLNFSHEYVLKMHIAGQKHQRKVNAIDLLKSLLGSEPGLEIEPESGNGRCSFCDVTFYSPQHVSRHLTGEKHLAKKNGRENGTGGQVSTISSTNANSSAKTQKTARPQLTQNLSSFIIKTGDRFLCNPCQSQCNSDVQLQQHLASKKHIDKVSGRKKAQQFADVTGVKSDGWRGRGRGGNSTSVGGRGRGRGRGRGSTSLSSESYTPSWAESLLTPSTSSFFSPSALSIDYGHGSYSETSFTPASGSYEEPSIETAPAADYGYGGSFAENSSRPIGGGKYAGFSSRSDPSPYARPEVVSYGRGASASYERSESYPRPEYEFQTTVEEMGSFRKPVVADYIPEGYRKTTVAEYVGPAYGAGHHVEGPRGAGHNRGRGMPLSYQPLSHSFIPSSSLM